jgi:hypothetical protein
VKKHPLILFLLTLGREYTYDYHGMFLVLTHGTQVLEPLGKRRSSLLSIAISFLSPTLRLLSTSA